MEDDTDLRAGMAECERLFADCEDPLARDAYRAMLDEFVSKLTRTQRDRLPLHSAMATRLPNRFFDDESIWADGSDAAPIMGVA